MNKWIGVIVLALGILTSAMGLKAVTTTSSAVMNPIPQAVMNPIPQ